MVFEGEYLNGKRNGKGKEYLYYYGPLEFNYKPHYSDGPSNTNDRYGYDGFFFIYIHLIHLKVNIKMEKGMEKEKNFIRMKK